MTQLPPSVKLGLSLITIDLPHATLRTIGQFSDKGRIIILCNCTHFRVRLGSTGLFNTTPESCPIDLLRNENTNCIAANTGTSLLLPRKLWAMMTTSPPGQALHAINSHFMQTPQCCSNVIPTVFFMQTFLFFQILLSYQGNPMPTCNMLPMLPWSLFRQAASSTLRSEWFISACST